MKRLLHQLEENPEHTRYFEKECTLIVSHWLKMREQWLLYQLTAKRRVKSNHQWKGW
jgi:hypothetical protein